MKREKCTVVQKSMGFLSRKPMVSSALIPSFRGAFRGLGEGSEGRNTNFRIRVNLSRGGKVYTYRKSC